MRDVLRLARLLIVQLHTQVAHALLAALSPDIVLAGCPTRSSPSQSPGSPLRQGNQNLELLQVQATLNTCVLENSRQLGPKVLPTPQGPPTRRCSVHSGHPGATSASAPQSSRPSPPSTRREDEECAIQMPCEVWKQTGQRAVPHKQDKTRCSLTR